MKITNVYAIHDYKGVVTIELGNGVEIELPIGQHTITIDEMNNPADHYVYNLDIKLYSH